MVDSPMVQLGGQMQEIKALGTKLQLLPERAIYIESLSSLLVSDIHLGKSETFQARGVPIPNQINQHNLERLHQLCTRYEPKNLFILGDLFHSKLAMVDTVIDGWSKFVAMSNAKITLIIGNHDRHLKSDLHQFAINLSIDAILINNLVLSHEPTDANSECLNICGHIHPCIRLKSGFDYLRLPCFYFKPAQNLLMLPSFGEFTGSYEMPLARNEIAYVVADDAIVEITSR